MRNGWPTVRSLHVAASVAPRDGGASTAMLNTVRALNDIGDDALIVTTTADGPHGELQRSTCTPMMEREAPVWYCRRSQPMRLKNSWQQARRVLRQAREVSVIHVHGVYLANSIWAYVASRLTGIPYVLQPHGTLEPYQEAQNSRRKFIFNRLIGNRILANAGALVATSMAEAENLGAAYPAAKVVVVPLGTASVSPKAPPVHPEDPWVAIPHEQRVVFLGRLATKKRPDLLMDAWNTLNEGHLLLAGPEEDWTWADLRSRLCPERQASVTYLGTLDESEVAWALEACGILVLPSENENFGLVVTEAMIHGCAVLTTVQTAASEHVVAARSGTILDELCETNLADALTQMLQQPDTVREMGSAARAYAQARLTWEASARRLHDVYTNHSAQPSSLRRMFPLIH